jgi:alkanesulfonate monooxygenase SsuD/methylene tetrahydromethanopterin reductase-like flavin-dependent oxidoreductase (luciferase family)
MKVGVSLWFQNQVDFHDRAKVNDYSHSMAVSDLECYRNELRLADLVEPLGYDSLWTIEHHFGPYGMACNPLQLYSYMAGRTDRIDFGTMVIVLPWHDPIRVAEGIAMLDNFLNRFGSGRRLLVGFGRGAAQQEFDAFRVDYANSRERMDEALEIVRLALTQEWFSFEGKVFQIPRTTIRPQPVTKDLTKNILLAWASQETLEWAANTGGGQLFSNVASWDMVAPASEAFNAIRARHGWHQVPPFCLGGIYCAGTKAEAEEARQYRRDIAESTIWHYGILRQPSLRKRLEGKQGAELDAEMERIFDDTAHAAVAGTPDECIEQLLSLQKRLGMGYLLGHFNFGRLPVEMAEKSMRLFAKEVLPVLHSIEAPEFEATPYAQVRSERESAVVAGAR